MSCESSWCRRRSWRTSPSSGNDVGSAAAARVAGRLRRVQCLWAPQEKIFQYVVALDRGQWLTADLAVQRLMRHAMFGLDTNDLIVRLTMRAGKILSAIVGHHYARLPRPLIPLHSYAPMTDPSRSSNAARHSRARCTRLRSVPIGQSQARAAS